jgi:hypothetical protein
MLKRKIATVKARFSHIAETETPAHVLMNDKLDREENALLTKILTGIPRRPPGLRTYTNRINFKRQMAIDVVDKVRDIQNQKDDQPPKWQNQDAFRIREAYKVEKWKELSSAERQRWIEEGQKETNKEIENMTP